MGAYAERHARRLIDRADDKFVSRVESIEMIGSGLMRATFSVNLTDHEGHLMAVPADFAIVMPLSALPDAVGKALAVTARTIIAKDDGSLTLRQ